MACVSAPRSAPGSPAVPPAGPWVPPVLVACAHGTGSAAGRRELARLRLAVAAARTGLEVVAAHADVEVQRPGIARVLTRLAERQQASVVVPLLLSTGYHVEQDIGDAVAAPAARGLAIAAAPLGPDELLIDVLVDRLRACGARRDDAVVLAAAGSRRPRAQADVAWTARRLAERWGAAVEVGYLAGAPSLGEVVTQLRARRPGVTVTLAAYLLAPSAFGDRLASAGADRVAAPLVGHPALIELTLARYDQACREARYSLQPRGDVR
ncbi:MAG: sirohydrochlorin chelatase [Kineosporiaceae bacterium]|nr:sirohydrochlorin chelatase [Kineosporiaceae bacterium]MBK7625436.1 sirohydrochlorin chelatase [Kineosporiaceae bacterium]MBK8076201.1 sirohydrochlorin chelatase [Kineosporiaceae bacterium]